MARNPKRTTGSEIAYHVREGNYSEALEIARHESVKKGVERGLWLAGSNPIGRKALRTIAGAPIDDPRLHTTLGKLEMDGPTGLAPGWDKIGHTVRAWQNLGARHMTLGAATLFRQNGCVMPRLRTMDEQAGDHGNNVSQNALGFNSPGIDQLLYNAFKQIEGGGVTIPIIIQITLNKEFYEEEFRTIIRPALVETVKRALQLIDGVKLVKGISLGLSSPNTTGMRQAQDEGLKEGAFLSEAINAVGYTAKEIDPDITIVYKGDGDGGDERLDRYARTVEVKEKRLIDVLEIINTTRLPNILAKYKAENLQGGIAGNDEDYKKIALGAIRRLYERVGSIVDIIGTGGGAHQAFEMIEAGASAVGINTGVRTRGLGVMRKVEREIIERIDQDYPEIISLNQVIGAKTKRGPKYQAKESEEERAERWKRGIRTGNYSVDPSRYE